MIYKISITDNILAQIFLNVSENMRFHGKIIIGNGGAIMNNKLKTWHFGIDNDRLVELVLSGKKTATTSLYDKDNLPNVDEESILIFDNEKKACITKTKKVIITEFKNISEELSNLEGEGTFKEWKNVHIEYFKSINPNFNEDTKVVFEIFEVTENLIERRMQFARKIAQTNRDIFGDIVSIEEINAGFNNSIFCVNGKYIIKVCGDEAKESLFDVEANFYNSNQDNETIPTLYRYDKSKDVVPYVYEIIEKIDGKSVYYYWYKMDESQREELIRELVQALKNIHFKEYQTYDWSSSIKERVLTSFNQTIDMFGEEERNIVLESIGRYDEILSDNKFCLIHNDLHFDNILLDDKHNIKLIDFNDSLVAPFDFDLRLLYMSVALPWKWANIEMDPFQKPEDYQNLFEYVKKYYTELNNIKYLDERMTIYWVLDDFELLPRFRNNEGKERILMNCRKILDSFRNTKVVK